MAIAVTITRRRAIRLPVLFRLPSLLSNPLRRCSPSLSSPPPRATTLFFPPFPFSFLSSRRPISSIHLQHRLFSFRNASSDPESSDFESDSEVPISLLADSNKPESPLDESDLPGFFQLLSQAKSLSSSRKEALAFLRSASSIEPTKDLACRALWQLRWDWESAFLAFQWAEESVLDCPWAWHLMVWVLGKQGRFDLAWSLVRRMYRKSVLTQRALVTMMERYAAANEPGKAIKTFHAMEKFKIKVDSSAFYALLCALCKNKNVEEAEELLLLNRKFFPLTAESFNIVLDGWGNIIDDVVEAKRVWREMSNSCITPDGASYAHMIRCFSKAGSLYDSLRLYDEMKKRGWVPDLVVYNSLIYVLIRENCLKEANNIFEKIIESGLQPDVGTFNSMISPLCEKHKLEEAQLVINEMMVKGIHPTIETYHAFAKAEDMEGTLKLLRSMRDTHCGPNKITFLLILEKFFGLGKPESALRMWSEMRRYSVIPDASHYMVVVQGLVKDGWIPKALEFYDEMKSLGFPADPKHEKLFNDFISDNKNHWGGGQYAISQRRNRNTLTGAKVH